ncbi:MAG: SgcJ/EcaC family oxidoreductase [Acetobacteraceae bacterium]|nr:SgcJ/EcaC family oxidoreductase [Acetobacteraceae bacterium]
MIERRLFGISAGLALAGLAAPVLAAGEREAVEAAYRAWNDAFNKGDAKALAAHYTENALLLPPTHDVAKGRAAIERFFDGVFKAGVTGHTLELIEAEGDQRGVAAAARWAAKQRQGGGEQALSGTATHVFERRPGGGLSLWLHAFN